ncbi:MAG: ExbD/TolR family protein [Comamonas sp.]
MPSSASRGSRKRRSFNEINMVPFIDVMLVLLIIFMVTAPMLTPGSIKTPSAGKSDRPQAKNVAYVLLDKDGSLSLKTGSVTQPITLQELGRQAKSWQDGLGAEQSAVLIAADKNLSYQKVMDVMSALQGANVQRVALSVAGGSAK